MPPPPRRPPALLRPPPPRDARGSDPARPRCHRRLQDASQGARRGRSPQAPRPRRDRGGARPRPARLDRPPPRARDPSPGARRRRERLRGGVPVPGRARRPADPRAERATSRASRSTLCGAIARLVVELDGHATHANPGRQRGGPPPRARSCAAPATGSCRYTWQQVTHARRRRRPRRGSTSRPSRLQLAALRPRSARAPTTRRPPRLGIMVTLRCTACSGSASSASRSSRRAISVSTTRCSAIARAAPRQRRMPPPKGIHS